MASVYFRYPSPSWLTSSSSAPTPQNPAPKRQLKRFLEQKDKWCSFSRLVSFLCAAHRQREARKISHGDTESQKKSQETTRNSLTSHSIWLSVFVPLWRPNFVNH